MVDQLLIFNMRLLFAEVQAGILAQWSAGNDCVLDDIVDPSMSRYNDHLIDC